MVHEKNEGINKDMVLPPIQQNRPAFSSEMKIKKKVKRVPSCLGKFRPTVGQCCHHCTPNSLNKKLGQNSSLGFHNILNVNETQTRYRGWLVRRVCCVLFVSGCKIHTSPVSNRLERVCQSNRVKETITAEHKAPEGAESQGQCSLLSPFVPLINTCISPGVLRFMGWLMLKTFPSLFDRVQVNLNHLSALQRASQVGTPLVYVHVRQSIIDCALIPLVLFCHGLRVPFTICPFQSNSTFLRSILQKVGVILLPSSSSSEQEAETDALYTSVMTSLVRELLHEGQALSVGVSEASGHGGQWLARIRQLIKEGSVADVNVVPVGISYDCLPKTIVQPSLAGLSSVLRWLCSLLWRKRDGSVRIHLAQPFSLKEMCDSGRCTVDEWLPLQDLLLPVILNNRSKMVFGRRRMSWLLPSEHKGSTHPERDLSTAIILHLIFSTTSSMAVMSTSLVSSLLLYRHSKGVSLSSLCRDVAWLTEELLFRNKDVGFGGTLVEVVHYSVSLLAPHLIIAAVPSRTDPFFVPRPSLASILHLNVQAQIVTRTFILEAVGAVVKKTLQRLNFLRDLRKNNQEEKLLVAFYRATVQSILAYCITVWFAGCTAADESSAEDGCSTPLLSAQPGACAVSALLCDVAHNGVSSKVRSDGVDREEVKGDMEFEVVLCQTELMQRALQLCHLLPPGFMPPCQSTQSFALDAVDSLVNCGILIMEEVPRDIPLCDFWKGGALNWNTTDDPYQSDSDCEDQDQYSYKISQPRQCPEMLFFLCRMLAGHLRALCWTTTGLEYLQTPLPEAEFVAQVHAYLCGTANKKKQNYESCSEEAAHTAVRTLIDLGVLSQERQEEGGVFLGISPLFQLSENRQKLQRFISQYLYN